MYGSRGAHEPDPPAAKSAAYVIISLSPNLGNCGAISPAPLGHAVRAAGGNVLEI